MTSDVLKNSGVLASLLLSTLISSPQPALAQRPASSPSRPTMPSRPISRPTPYSSSQDVRSRSSRSSNSKADPIGVLLALALGGVFIAGLAIAVRHSSKARTSSRTAVATGVLCPKCRRPPYGGNSFWECTGCRKTFDTFKSRGRCPKCSYVHTMTTCLACLEDSPHAEFYRAEPRGEMHQAE